MDYQLTITPTGHPSTRRTVTGDSPTDLAATIHRHARGLLGGQVDIQLDFAALTGSIVQHHAHVGQFALKPIEHEPTPTPDTSAPDHVAHGYTLRDLHALARTACAADRSLSSDMITRYDTAWSAIAEHLCTAETPPGWNELTRVGWQAIYTEIREQRHLYGIPRDYVERDDCDRRFAAYWQPQLIDEDKCYGNRQRYAVATAPRFAIYWRPVSLPPADEQLTERIAVHQVLATLPEHQREAVVALAAQEDYQRAAESLGLKYGTLTARIRLGRGTFRDLWFSPETAPPTKGTDRRVASRAGVSTHCPQDHEYTPENTRYTRRGKDGRKSRRCRACERARGAARRQHKQELAVA
ncbi:hypothetical protein [Streptomyces natalensis]|uniref:hypothetical protein n=1 Tax=Streptomyces natalensis TaxID=68242 RepID=UPI00055ADC74|nr:hypothetical protein [Streptomyces natalensis]